MDVINGGFLTLGGVPDPLLINEVRSKGSGLKLYANGNGIFVAEGGNVGVEEANPTHALHINGGLRVGNTSTAAAGAIRWTGANFEGYTGSAWVPLDVQSLSGGGWTDDGTVVRLTTASDKVGIGTASPAVPLEVDGEIRVATSSGTARYRMRPPSGSNAEVRFDNGATTMWGVYNDAGSGNELRFAQGGTNVVATLTGPGRFGLNNSNPAVGIHIGATASAHALTGTDDIIVSGKSEFHNTLYANNNMEMAAQKYFLIGVFTNAQRPAAGNAGRIIFNTDDGNLNIDDGTNWILPNGTAT